MLGRYDEALLFVDKALALDPKDEFALSNKAHTLSQKKRHTAAVQYCDESLAIKPKNNAIALNTIIGSLRMKGQYDAAIKYCDEALAINPRNVFALSIKGEFLRIKGQYDAAIQCCDEALTIDYDNIYALHSKIMAWGTNVSALVKDFDGFLKYCYRLSQAKTRDALEVRIKGEALFEQGKYDTSLMYIDWALAYSPQDAFLLLKKGSALIKQGRYNAAVQCWNEVLFLIEDKKISQSFVKDPLFISTKKVLLAGLHAVGLAYAKRGEYVESLIWQAKAKKIDPFYEWKWEHDGFKTPFKASVDRYYDATSFNWPTEKWRARKLLMTAEGSETVEQLSACLERAFKLKFLTRESSATSDNFKEMTVSSDPESPEEKLIDNLLVGWLTLNNKKFEDHQRVIECIVEYYARPWREECWLDLDEKGIKRILDLLIAGVEMITTSDEQIAFLKQLDKIQTSISLKQKPGVGIKPRLTYQLGVCPDLHDKINEVKTLSQLLWGKKNRAIIPSSLQPSAKSFAIPQISFDESPAPRQRTKSMEKAELKYDKKVVHKIVTDIKSDWMISRSHYELDLIQETRLQEFRSIIQAAMSNFLSAVKTVSSDKVDPNAPLWASFFDSMTAFSVAFIPCAGPALSTAWGAIRPVTYFWKESEKSTYQKLSALMPLFSDADRFITEFSSLITAYHYTEILTPSRNRTYMERIKDFMTSGTVWEGFKGYINTKIEECITGIDDKVEHKRENYKAHWSDLISYFIGSFLVNLDQLSFEDVQNNTLALKLSASFTTISSDPLTFNAKANEFNFTNAHTLVRLSFLAYETEQKIDQLARLWGYEKEGREKRYQFIFENDFQAFMLADREKICVVFRGTATVVNALTDMHIYLSKGKDDAEEIKIHTGFMNSLSANWHLIKRFIERGKKEAQKQGSQPGIWFTGHSLGGALATMAAFRYFNEEESVADHIHLYTYGQPKCGNLAFANYMNQYIKDYQRFVNYLDPFTEVPFEGMGYAHAGQERWIDVNGDLHDKASHEHKMQEKDGYGQQKIRDNLFTRQKHLWDHSVYLEKIGKIAAKKGVLVYNFAEYMDVECSRSRPPIGCTNLSMPSGQKHVGVSAENVPSGFVRQEVFDKAMEFMKGELNTTNQTLTKVQLELEKEKKEKNKLQESITQLRGDFTNLYGKFAELEWNQVNNAAFLPPQQEEAAHPIPNDHLEEVAVNHKVGTEDGSTNTLYLEAEVAIPSLQNSSKEPARGNFSSVLSQPRNVENGRMNQFKTGIPLQRSERRKTF